MYLYIVDMAAPTAAAGLKVAPLSGPLSSPLTRGPFEEEP